MINFAKITMFDLVTSSGAVDTMIPVTAQVEDKMDLMVSRATTLNVI